MDIAVNWLLMTSSYTHRLMHLSTITSEDPVFSRWWLTETHTWSRCREYDTPECSGLKETSILHLPLSGFGKIIGKEWLKHEETETVEDDKETVSSEPRRASAHLDSQQCDSLQETMQAQARPNTSMVKEAGHEIPALTKKQLVMVSSLERENWFF